MHQVDPMSDWYSSLTPYNYAFNNPIHWNDPNGADPNPGEPDHVTRRGINLFGIANSSGGIGFYGSGLDYGDGSGIGLGNFTLFDMNWAGGYGNVGGIQLGSSMANGTATMVKNGQVYVRDPSNTEWVSAQAIVDYNSQYQNYGYVMKAANALMNFNNQGSGPYSLQNVRDGFGQWGQSFVNMGKAVWNAIPKVPNVRFVGGSNRGVNEKNGPPPTPGAKSIWAKIDEATEELMEMLGLALGQSQYSKETVKDASIGPEKEGEAIGEALGPDNVDPEQSTNKNDTIFYPGDNRWFYDASDSTYKAIPGRIKP